MIGIEQFCGNVTTYEYKDYGTDCTESLQTESDKCGYLNYQANTWSEGQRAPFFDIEGSLIS